MRRRQAKSIPREIRGDDAKALRELAATWVQANCPNPAVHKDFLGHLDHAVARGVGCTFLVGRELTKRAKPMLVACYCGELFAFELTKRQAKQLKMRANALTLSSGAVRHDHGPKPEPLVWLERIDVDSADGLVRNAPITGALHYRTNRMFREPLAVHVTCEPLGRASVTLLSYPPALHPPAGIVRLSFPALGKSLDRRGEPFIGAVPLFFRVFTADEPAPPVAAPHAAPKQQGQFPSTSRPQPPPPTSSTPSIKPKAPLPPPLSADIFGASLISAAAEVKPVSDIRAVLVDLV